jgi:glycosyltransferase involved in cell wall biosynthesis
VTKKVIVAHPGTQHSFRLAESLKQNGLLLKYVTTTYNKSNSWFRKFVYLFLNEENKKKALNKRCEALDDDDVVEYYRIGGLLTYLLVRVDKKKIIYRKWNKFISDRFSIKVAKLAIHLNADMVIMYDTSAGKGFRYLMKKAPNIIRVMDVSHANRLYEKLLFEQDMKIMPEFANSLRKEKDFLWNDNLNWVNEEIKSSQYFLAPSKYVERSLIFSNVSSDQVRINPYGVDPIKFHTPIDNDNNDDSIYFIYIGNVTEAKGIGHLLKAFKIVNEKYSGTYIHIVGGKLSEELKKEYGYCTISHGYVSHDEVSKLLRKADVMVFPSLSEGMTLSGLEALASGVPLICTKNSGVNDLITDGYNGFVVPICDSNAIAARIIWFIENKSKIDDMKSNARSTGVNYSWDDYYKRTGEIINDLLCEEL